MAVTYLNSTSKVNTDVTTDSVVIPFVGSTNDCIVVFVGIQSKSVVVASVVDDEPNTYIQRANTLANDEVDFSQGSFDTNPLLHNYVKGEMWVVRSAGAVTKITVTLTAGARFAVAVVSYLGGSAFGVAGVKNMPASRAPSHALVTTAANSFVSAGFFDVVGLDLAASTGTLRVKAYGGSREGGVGVAVVDNTSVGLASCNAAAAASETEILGGTTLKVPAAYASCAVEIKA